MTRIKKNREMNIVHFSFFDLLFGAFGAFVFLMIVQVISSINMVDLDFQKMVDNLVKEKSVLNNQLTDLQRLKSQLNDLQKELDGVRNERDRLDGDRVRLNANNILLQKNITTLRQQINDLTQLGQTVQREQKQLKILQYERKELQQKLTTALAEIKATKPPPLKMKPSIYPTAITGEKVNIGLAVQGGLPPYSWELSGEIPPGLSFNPIDGFLTGTLKNHGKFSFSVTVTDKRGFSVTSGPVTMKIIKKYEEQKKKISSIFALIAGICATMLFFKAWERHKINRYTREMEEQGYELMWTPKN